MFASRRSSLSSDKLPCLNIAFLTCCLLVIGHVSSMSLDRLGRQYQQQNDKQLEFSELMLPEAEIELLQNDMDLIPALDGNSDMYLLVPASAASLEQNLQVLTQPNEFQNSANVENNSDMLMLESEDTPAMQILELPEDELERKLREELEANSELDEESHLSAEDKKQTLKDDEQISDGMINIIAEAAQEIKNEIETELVHSEETIKNEDLVEAENAKLEEELSLTMEHKDIEAENIDNNAQDPEKSEQEMIGVVMEESNEQPAASLEIEKQQESEKIDEDLQAEVPNMQLIHQPEEQMTEESTNKIKETHFDDNEKVEEQKAEMEILDNETNQVNMEVDKQITSEELENPMADEKQIIVTNIEMQDSDETLKPIGLEMEAANKIQAAAQEVDEDQAVEESQAVEDTSDNERTKIVEDPQVNDEIQTFTEEENQVNDIPAEKNQAELIYAEKNQADAETQVHVDIAENKQTKDVQPLEAESLENLHDIPASETNEEDLENHEESVSSIVADEKQPFQKIQSDAEIHSVESDYPTNVLQFNEVDNVDKAQLTSDSQIVVEFHTDDADITPADESKIFESNEVDKMHVQSTPEDQLSEKIHPNEETQDLVDAQDPEQDQKFEDKVLNIENIKEEDQPIDETFEETQNMEELQSLKEIQYVEEFLNHEDTQPEKSETADEAQHIKYVQNLQTSAEAQHDKETEDVLEAQPTETELIPAIEESQPDEHFQKIEGSNALDKESQSLEFAESVEEGQSNQVENMQSGDNLHITVTQHSFDEETKDAEDSKPLLYLPEIQKSETHEFPAEQPDIESVDAMPVSNSSDKPLAEESKKQDDKDETSGQLIILADENILHNNLQVEDNQNEKHQHETVEIQKPLKENDSDNITNNKNDSEPIKDTSSMLQAPTKEELTQQEQQQPIEHAQSTIVETASLTTFKPLNVLDSVLNYVNASFMNQMSNDNNNNKQEVIKEQQVFSSKLRRYDGAQVWRIVVQNERERKLADELQTKFDGQLWKEVKQEVDYLLKPQVLGTAEQHVRAANLSRIVLIDNLQKVIEVENPPAEEIALLQNRKGSRLTWQAYHRLDDIHAYIDYLAKTYPDICSVETIGYSIEKRPLKILKISNGNANNPGIWIDGGIHAREWISPAVVTYVANQIVEGWDDLPAYMRNVNWYVHAVVNPDGYEYSHTTDRLWRKNMRSHGRACPGVDLNRNFGYKWGGKGTSANPCAQTYRGSKAFSEPETFYISKFISNFARETFKAYLSFHSYGQYILYPWGYDNHITKDMADLDLVARQAGTIITKSTGTKFTVGSSATTLYPAAGGSDDWAKGIAGIKYSYTIEMGDTGRYGFILPAEYIVSNGKNGLTFVETVAKTITMGKNGRRRKLKAHRTL